VLQTAEAIDFIIQEHEVILGALPSHGSNQAYIANKNAARTLLMKIYLNKGTILKREAPTFATEDMNKVIALAGEIESAYAYSILALGKYFDKFAPDNDVKSTENIFSLYNKNGERGGNIDRTWNTIAHYNMRPGGWNGWCTLPDYYNKFSEAD